MAYGASAYGAGAFGGAPNGNQQVFFADALRTEGHYESRADVSVVSDFYEILTAQGGEEPPIEYRIYSSHGEGETPQLQVIVSGVGQTIIGAAPIILVTADITDIAGNSFSVRGRPYTQ